MPRSANVRLTVSLIGFVEIIIGCATISGLIISTLFALSEKPVNVFVFVLISALISSLLGIGLLKRKNLARRLLIFFSGWVVLTKILVFIEILQFQGELITAVSDPVKNTSSIIYHLAVMLLLNHVTFKKEFLPSGEAREK